MALNRVNCAEKQLVTGGRPMPQGYQSEAYARSLREFGTPLELPGCGGWLLQRTIPGEAQADAMGCYPVFACRNWSALEADLENVRGRLVSVALVTDPFGDYTPEMLRRAFGTVVWALKSLPDEV
jgi:hypothetical protein